MGKARQEILASAPRIGLQFLTEALICSDKLQPVL
jgi:hypothetical protein